MWLERSAEFNLVSRWEIPNATDEASRSIVLCVISSPSVNHKSKIAIKCCTKETESKLHCTRGNTPKHETSGGIHLHGVASGKHGGVAAVVTLCPICPVWESNSRPTSLKMMCSPTMLTANERKNMAAL